MFSSQSFTALQTCALGAGTGLASAVEIFLQLRTEKTSAMKGKAQVNFGCSHLGNEYRQRIIVLSCGFGPRCSSGLRKSHLSCVGEDNKASGHGGTFCVGGCNDSWNLAVLGRQAANAGLRAEASAGGGCSRQAAS